MADSRSVSIRLAISKLNQIDAYCDSENKSRSDFMSGCAMTQAERIIKRKAPSYVMPWSDANEKTTTITINLNGHREDAIEEACEMLNQKISLFIVWATIAELEKLITYR